jgi:hypothetical protein
LLNLNHRLPQLQTVGAELAWSGGSRRTFWWKVTVIMNDTHFRTILHCT